MTRVSRLVVALALLAPLVGCAGGWRNGVPPQWAGEGATAAVANPATTAPPKASADGVTFRYIGDANTVHLAGEFNAWSTSADALTKAADGSWSITKKLAPGRYPYKFVVNGTDWKEDPSAKESVDDGFGGKNALVVVGVAAVSAAPPVAAAAPVVSGDGVTFRFTGAANSVHLAGEFNAWSTSADALTKAADGSWSLTKKLAPGRYPYKFVVNGTDWKEDPSAKESVDDGFGGKNSVIVVGAAAVSAAAPVAAAAPVVSGDGVTFRFTGAANSVHLAGEFNAWSTSADALTKAADGSWSLTKKLAPGRYPYKFVVNGTDWKEDPSAKESVDDGFGGKNSVIVVGTASVSAAAPVAASAGAAPVVSGDGVTFRFTGAANSVHLAGEFNAWSTSADALTKAADGSWSLTKKLAPGRYPYKFVVNGTDWKEDPSAKESVDDGFGGKNSVIVVGAASGSNATAAAIATTIAVTGKPRAPEVTPTGVRFTYAGVAKSVALCGGFNDWAPNADPMTRNADGTWTIVRKLPAGSHAYKFLVDGAQWRTDEANPSGEDDGFGGKNSVIVVK